MQEQVRLLCDGNELFVMNCDEYETLCDDGAKRIICNKVYILYNMYKT